MADLTDRELRNFDSADRLDLEYGHSDLLDVAVRLASEIRRHRGARAADKERGQMYDTNQIHADIRIDAAEMGYPLPTMRFSINPDAPHALTIKVFDHAQEKVFQALHRKGYGPVLGLNDLLHLNLAESAEAVRATDRERVRAVVRKLITDRDLTTADIADRVADALATPTPALTTERARSVPGTKRNCPRCGKTSIEIGPDGDLLEHYSLEGIGGVCSGLRGCPCDDGDGEGCPIHGIGSQPIADRVAEQLAGSSVPVCPSCNNEIDPDLCHCGTDLANHSYEGHAFAPMGCDCGREPEAPVSPERVYRIRFEIGREEFALSVEEARRLRDCLNRQLAPPPSEAAQAVVLSDDEVEHLVRIRSDIDVHDAFVPSSAKSYAVVAVLDKLIAAHRKAP